MSGWFSSYASVQRPVFESLESRRLLAVNVLTYHNDNARDGANLAEAILAPANVNTSSFAKLFSYAVDGYVYAQPLLKTGVNIPGKGVHDVLLIATEHDSVYAFDANSNAGANAAPLWKTSFINPAAGITTVPSADTGTDDLVPEVGITGTPVIDPSTNTLYVVAKTREPRGAGYRYVQRLHALDIATGAEKLGGPVVIAATLPGTGAGNNGQGSISFNALIEHQRPALTLLNGVVYIAWASHGDNGPYHGWVMGYNASTLRQTAAFNDTPDGSEGGIWMSGGGLSSDGLYLYLSTGNGTFDANTGGADYGDSVLKLNPQNLGVSDYFTPFNQGNLQATDSDLGSGGALLLPVQPGAYPREMMMGGKEGKLYIVNRDNLGQYRSTRDRVVQEIPNAFPQSYSTAAYFNGAIYHVASAEGGGVGNLQAFALTNGLITSTTQSAETFPFPAASPSISASGAAGGIVWFLSKAPDGHALLSAYDATDVTHPIYTSDQAGVGDNFGNYVKFSVPIVANGKVYAASQGGVAVFGLTSDTGAPPVATLASAPTLSAYSRYYSFVVSYYAGPGFDLASFDSSNIIVTGANGFSAPAGLVSSVRGQRSTIRIVTYAVHGPGRAWDASDNGVYTVNMQANQVRDANGRFVAAGALGTFTVSIPAPAAVPKSFPSIASATTPFQSRRKINQDPVWDQSA